MKDQRYTEKPVRNNSQKCPSDTPKCDINDITLREVPLTSNQSEYTYIGDVDEDMLEAFFEDNELDSSLLEARDLLSDSLTNNSFDAIANEISEEMDTIYQGAGNSRGRALISSTSSTPDTGATNYFEYFDHIKKPINKEDPRYFEVSEKGVLINAVGVWRNDLGRHSFNKKWMTMQDMYTEYTHVHNLDSFTGINASIINILLKDLKSMAKIKKHKNSVTGHVYIEPTPGMYSLPMFKNEATRGVKSLIRLSFPRAKSAHHRRCLIPVYNAKDNTLRLCLYKVQEKVDLITDIAHYSQYVKDQIENHNLSLSVIGVNKNAFSPDMLRALLGKNEYTLCDKHALNVTYKGSTIGIQVVPQDIKIEHTSIYGMTQNLHDFMEDKPVIYNVKTSRFKHDIVIDNESVTINGEKGFSFIAGTLAVLY